MIDIRYIQYLLHWNFDIRSFEDVPLKGKYKGFNSTKYLRALQ